ncbi:MAG TPA: heme ABC exporter ATP-binding protein CcmA [Myxococcota bacterium]|jgi:heme ABC exporter ATP-binding subunit CcmA|nr:heme ABC exporter ATP-binding protein CcmA [Myxococcota bacterium]
MRVRALDLRADRVVRIAGRRHLLRDVTLSATSGELVAVLGRNGAGKTTLLSVLAGRQNPDGGRVTLAIDGRPATGAAARAAIGMLPHDLLIYPDLTARENLAFFMTLAGRAPDGAFVSDVLARIGLARDGDRPVRQFSRGMQQRTALGRLLVSGADAWVLDEPTTGLDESGRRWLLALLSEQVAAGRLVLMSSHHPSEVAACATRTVVLEAGRVVLDGPGGADGTAAAFARMDGGAA